MSTTTIRLPEELKARVARVAKDAGTTAHSVIVEAVQQHVEQAELRAGFLREGRDRLARMEAGGASVPWAEARQYLLDRVAGKQVARPKARNSAGKSLGKSARKLANKSARART